MWSPRQPAWQLRGPGALTVQVSNLETWSVQQPLYLASLGSWGPAGQSEWTVEGRYEVQARQGRQDARAGCPRHSQSAFPLPLASSLHPPCLGPKAFLPPFLGKIASKSRHTGQQSAWVSFLSYPHEAFRFGLRYRNRLLGFFRRQRTLERDTGLGTTGEEGRERASGALNSPRHMIQPQRE